MKFSQLLDSTPKWQHKDANVRLKAINTAELDADILLSLAKDDPDAEVQQAAISKLNDVDTLVKLWPDSSAEIQGFIVIRWAALIDMPNLAKTELSQDFLQSLVKADVQAELKLAAVTQIDDQQRLLDIMRSHLSSKVYQAIAEKITDEALLHKLQKLFLNRDKNVVKMAKQKLSVFKEQRQEAAEFQADLDRTFNAAEKLASSDFADDFERKLKALVERWQQLEQAQMDIPSESQALFRQAVQQCQTTIEQVQADKELLEEQVNETLNKLFELTQALRKSTEILVEIPATVKLCRGQWPKGRDLAHLYALTSPLEQLSDQYQQWLKIEADIKSQSPAQLLQRLETLRWPEGFAEPSAIASSQVELKQALANIKTAQAEEKIKIDALDDNIKALQQAIDEGHLKQANKLISNLRGKIEKTGAPATYSNQLNHFSTKLKELRDWQGYATNPKREELCQAMEGLASDADMKPMKKSTAIKELQEEWKKLGASDSRQGQKLWAKFKQLGDKAFEPCALYFQEQKQKRQQNLELKRQLCVDLESYFEQQDWEEVNWKSVNDLLNHTRKQWRQSDDIQRSKRKKVFERYTAGMTAIQEKLAGEQDKNHKIKLDYIQAIADLLETDMPFQRVIDQTKTLQNQWKAVGTTRHQQDQKLWRQFRAECDKVFAKRDEHKQEEKKQADAETIVAREILTALKTYLDSEVLQQSEINKLRKQFNNVSFKGRKNPLLADFQKLLKKSARLMEQQLLNSNKLMISEFKRLANLCAQLETGDIDAQAFEAAWQSEIELDKTLSARIRQRKSQSLAGLSGPSSTTDQDPEKICIRLEILADIDSPQTSQQKRLAYQVERLNKELSQGQKETRSPREQALALQLDWYCLSVTNITEEQQGRLLRAEAKLGL